MMQKKIIKWANKIKMTDVLQNIDEQRCLIKIVKEKRDAIGRHVIRNN